MFAWLVSFKATYNNISVISWRSVLLVEETRIPGENHVLSQVTDKLYHIMSYISPWSIVWFLLFDGVWRHFHWYFSNIVAVQFYWWRTPDETKKNTDLFRVTDKLSHYAIHITLIENRTHNVSGDRHWLDRYKNVVVNSTTLYHTNTVTTAPIRIITL